MLRTSAGGGDALKKISKFYLTEIIHLSIMLIDLLEKEGYKENSNEADYKK
jgi:hypothetical protein